MLLLAITPPMCLGGRADVLMTSTWECVDLTCKGEEQEDLVRSWGASKHFHMGAGAWCLTKPHSPGCWQTCFVTITTQLFSVYRGVVIWAGEQEAEAGKHITADGVMKCSVLCFCSHASTGAPFLPRPFFFSPSHIVFITKAIFMLSYPPHFLSNSCARSQRARSESCKIKSLHHRLILGEIVLFVTW